MADDADFNWDDDDFDPDAGFNTKTTSSDDRWEGEDLDLAEKLKQEADKGRPTKTVSLSSDEQKKTKQERIEEKKAVRRQQEVANAASTTGPPLTAEEQIEEKLRLQKVQQEADLEVTKELFGVTNSSSSSASSIDNMKPVSSEDFDKFLQLLTTKLLSLEGSPHYVGFMDNLIRNSCVGFDPEDLRKISGTLTSLAQEKQRALKASKSKKKTKGTLGSVGKASKRVELSAFGDYDDDVGVDDTNDDFDFM